MGMAAVSTPALYPAIKKILQFPSNSPKYAERLSHIERKTLRSKRSQIAKISLTGIDTLSSPVGSHTRAYTPKHGVSQCPDSMGRYHDPQLVPDTVKTFGARVPGRLIFVL